MRVAPGKKSAYTSQAPWFGGCLAMLAWHGWRWYAALSTKIIFGPSRGRALADVRGSAPCPLTYRPPGRLARLQGLLNSRSRGSGPTAPPTHHNRELNPARPLCDPAWRRRFHTQIRPSWRTQAARLVEAARRAGVPQARSGPHSCGRCARRSHDHRLSHPRSRASSHCRCWRPGPAAQRGGAGASLALRGA